MPSRNISLANCAQHLRDAVRHLALSSEPSQNKLLKMVEQTGFEKLREFSFPRAPLKEDFELIWLNLMSPNEPRPDDNIVIMSDAGARNIIARICELSDDVARALGEDQW